MKDDLPVCSLFLVWTILSVLYNYKIKLDQKGNTKALLKTENK